MDKKEVLEGNKLLAEFMGGKLCEGGFLRKSPQLNAYRLDGKVYIFQHLRYNSSWDWLMPVLEKIVSLNPDKGKEWYYYSMSFGHLRIYANTAFGISGEWKNNSTTTTINTAWKTVVEFIKWYNTNKK